MRRNISSTHIFFYLFIFEWIVLNSRAYRTYTLPDVNVCFPVKKSTLSLSKTAVLVNYTSGFLSHDFHDFRCEFQVNQMWPASARDLFEMPFVKKKAIIAVVQQMSLRKNETTGKCIDFVHFRTSKNNSLTLCGTGNANEAMNSPAGRRSDEVAPLAFVGKSIDVTLFLSGRRLGDGERLELSMAFTPSRECERNDIEYLTCRESSRDVCIRLRYFEDDVVNCPYYNCTDEFGCSPAKRDERYPSASKILSGIGSLIGSFVLFAACIFACHRCFKCMRRNQSNNRTPVVVPEVLQSAQSAPERPVLVPEQEEDKPPSYSTLFPDRTP